MRRRDFIAALGGAAAWPVVAQGQQKIFRIGVLSAGPDPTSWAFWAAFSDAMMEMGYVEGKNVVYEHRHANDRAGSGLIVLPSPTTLVQRNAIMTTAARNKVPTIYPYGFFAREGGLVSYGIVPSDNFRRAAAYVHRILKGEHSANLPVQVPTKFELVVNLKTAKQLGIEVPPTIIGRADEVIE